MPVLNKPFKILAIEGDQFLKIFFQDTFWLHGNEKEYDFHLVNDLNEAGKWLNVQKMPPDLIFIDIHPAADSAKLFLLRDYVSFVEKLRSDKKYVSAKIIIYSSFANRVLQRKFLAIGADRFLVKGWHLPSELLGIMREVCARCLNIKASKTKSLV